MSTIASSLPQPNLPKNVIPIILPDSNPAATAAIDAKYASLGGINGFLGPAVKQSQLNPGFGGYHNSYRGGSIYWSAATGAHAVGGDIGTKWFALGDVLGLLGYPVTDELTLPDGTGRYNHFQKGSIYWTPSTGAHEIHGDIYPKWVSLGAEQGLGYPVTDETATPDNIGRYNHFQKAASIYWTPSTGAHAVVGAIREKWASLSYERGFLGYPLTDEFPAGALGGRASDFQGGSIYWSPATGAREHAGALPDHLEFDQSYTFASGIAAGGSTHITLFRTGNFEFSGHMHDSGALAYNYSVACVLKDADGRAYSFAHTGNIAGTFESGSRDDNWWDEGGNELLAEGWRAVVASAGIEGVRNEARVSTDVGALVNNLLAGGGAVAGVVALVI